MESSRVEIIRQKADTFDLLPGMSSPDRKVKKILNQLCMNVDKPLVVFFDEADLLSGAGLLTFLAQIRDGYNDRDSFINKFPSSLALVGMRNIRNYLASDHPETSGQHLASPFNIVAERMTLANFTQEEIGQLYGQHTEATGQVFEESAIAKAWLWTEGQPWLVNALARQIVQINLKNDYSVVITDLQVNRAAENLIDRRDSHIDSLLERLKEIRVIKVMDSVFAGTKGTVPINSDDRQYCIDLGLVVKNEDQSLRPSNKIYQEVFSRVITDQIQYALDVNIDPKKLTDGKVLFMSDILRAFQKFWRHDSHSFPFRFKDFAAFKYDEATYSFMLESYLQKIVNSGGTVQRQFSEDRSAVDLAAIYNNHEYLIEVKLNEYYFDMDDAQAQLAGYLGAAGEKEGWLVIFDRDLDKSWDEKIYWDTKQIGKLTIHVVGC
jgi:hypothetical protein